MHWFDLGACIALLVSGIWSLFRGLTREVLSILGILTAFLLSLQGYSYIARHLESLITHTWLQQVVGFVLIFLPTIVLYAIFARWLHRLVKVAGLSPLDRLLGGLFGLIKVTVLMAALCLVTAQFFPTFATQLIRESALAPVFFRTADLLSTLLPAGTTNEFQRFYQQVRQQFPALAPPAPLPHTPPDPSAQAPASPAAPPQEEISESDAHALRQIIQRHRQNQ
jgi:membrane protein required for colicin V production